VQMILLEMEVMEMDFVEVMLVEHMGVLVMFVDHFLCLMVLMDNFLCFVSIVMEMLDRVRWLLHPGVVVVLLHFCWPVRMCCFSVDYRDWFVAVNNWGSIAAGFSCISLLDHHRSLTVNLTQC